MPKTSSNIGSKAAAKPATLVRDNMAVPAKTRELLRDQSNGLSVSTRHSHAYEPDPVLRIIVVMLLVRLALALFAGK